MSTVKVGNIPLGGGSPLVIIAGPCVVENRDTAFRTAEVIAGLSLRNIPVIYKSSFRKANRTSVDGFIGIGREEALRILADVREQFGLPLVTDIHSEEDAHIAAATVDMLQIPAFLCRQTDLLLAAGGTGKPVNIKKGQFAAPEDMKHAAEKVVSTGNTSVLLCERGSSFGYHDLVVDMRSLVIMRGLGYPVVMDATHAVQIPSKGGASGGRPEFIYPLARAAAAVGIDALFVETHPDPAKAMSDAGSQLRLDLLESLVREVAAIDQARRSAVGPHHQE